jgi:hypothetical protein
MTNLEKMIQSARNGEGTSFRDAFRQEASERLSAKLASAKADLAHTIFKKDVVAGAPQTAED